MAVDEMSVVVQQGVDYLARFQTHTLDVTWIQNVWDGDMSELASLPAGFEDIYNTTEWMTLFQQCAEAIREIFEFSSKKGDNTCDLSDTSFWLTIVQQGVSVKGLVILSNYFILRGNSRNSSYVDKLTALNAASTYIMLNCLRGSRAYRLFHAVVFESSLDVLKKCGCLITDVSKSTTLNNKQATVRKAKRRLSASSNSSSKKRRGANSHKSIQKNHLADDNEELEDCNSEDEVTESQCGSSCLSAHEVDAITECLFNFMDDLVRFFSHFSLKAYTNSLEHAIQCISQLFNVIPKTSECHSKPLISLCFKCIEILCGQSHGCPKLTFTVVMKYFLKYILSSENRVALTLLSHLVEKLPKDDTMPGTCTLVKQLCIRVPERADARVKVSSVVHAVINQLPPNEVSAIIKWLLMYMHNIKVTYRIFGLEVISLLLGHLPETSSLENIPQKNLKYLSDSYLLSAVIRRCSDTAATVRTKALSILAICIASNISAIQAAILSMFRPCDDQKTLHSSLQCSSSEEELRNRSPEKENGSVNNSCDAENSPSKTCHLYYPLPSSTLTLRETTNLLRCRTLDKKVHVRKSAIQVLQSVMEFNDECLSSDNIITLENQCRDPSLLVRKQALQSLTNILLARPRMAQLQLAWLNGVLPTIMDSESSIQEKCADAIDEVLLKNIVPYKQCSTPCHSMVWAILKVIVNDPAVHRLWRFILRGFSLLSRSGKLSERVISIIATHINTENDSAVWLLLSGLSSCVKVKKTDFVFEYFESHPDYIQHQTARMINCLRVMTSLASSTSKKNIAKYFKKLSELLEKFECPFSIIPALVSAVYHLYESGLDDNSTVGTLDSLFDKLLLKCETYLCSLISKTNKEFSNSEEELIIKHLVTLGEVSTICPKQVSRRTFLMMNTFLISSESFKSDESQSKKKRGNLPLFSERLRHFGLLVLGKLCIQHQNFAKECLPLLHMELETCDNPSVRHNIIVVMVDLCITYPSLVENYFPSLVACLKDPSLKVKKKTMAFITHLLQEDFIKWRGSLYVCFIASLVDKSPQVRAFTKYALLHVLKKPHPTMIFQHFMECLVFFNEYRDLEKYKISHSETEFKLFSLPGEKNFSKRITLFKFMLEHMTDDQRFQITSKLCQDILGAVVDNHITLQPQHNDSSNALSLVKDTLTILRCDEIKLTTLKAQDEFDEGDVEANLVATAKKTIISQVVKRNTIETIIPIVIALKHKLEKLLSPLLNDLMQYLKEIMKDYKAEIKDILAADKQLAIELEYDMRKFEQQQQQQLIEPQKRVPHCSEQNQQILNRSRCLSNSHVKSPTVFRKESEMALLRRSVIENPGSPKTDKIISATDASKEPATRTVLNDEVVAKDVEGDNVDVPNVSQHATCADANTSKTSRPFKKLCPKSKLNESLVDTSVVDDVILVQEPQQIIYSGKQLRIEIDRCDTPPRSSEKRKQPKMFTHLKLDLGNCQPSQNDLKTPRAVTSSQKRLSREILRAISTPSGVVTNITFSGEAHSDVSSLSPIVGSRVCQEATGRQLVVHVASPEARMRSKKQWAVKPPQTKRLSLILEN